MTATDGQFHGGGGLVNLRIKIWDSATGNVFCDNQMNAEDTAEPGTALGGGSIVVHKD